VDIVAVIVRRTVLEGGVKILVKASSNTMQKSEKEHRRVNLAPWLFHVCEIGAKVSRFSSSVIDFLLLHQYLIDFESHLLL
jgi:hypothetical protein